MTLSADYETLLTRYKALEDHLEAKERTTFSDKEELQMFYRKEADLLSKENELLKRELANAKEGLLLTQDKVSPEIINELSRENAFMKEEVVQVNTELGLLKEELRKALVRVREQEEELVLTREGMSQERKAEVKTLKEEFKITILQMESMQDDISKKDSIIKEQARQLVDKQEVEKELEELRKETRTQREELKTLRRRHGEAENDIAVKSLEVKDLKQKKSQVEGNLKQENELLTEELNYVSKEARVTKDELRITLKKLDSVEEELAVKNL